MLMVFFSIQWSFGSFARCANECLDLSADGLAMSRLWCTEVTKYTLNPVASEIWFNASTLVLSYAVRTSPRQSTHGCGRSTCGTVQLVNHLLGGLAD